MQFNMRRCNFKQRSTKIIALHFLIPFKYINRNKSCRYFNSFSASKRKQHYLLSGVFFDLSVWSTDELPSAKVFSIGSTATLIPYEHYFDGNEVFNITQAGIYSLKR